MKRLYTYFVSVAILCTSPVSSQAQTPPVYYWYYHVVDREGPVGSFTSLQYDTTEQPNIVYTSTEGELGRSIKFARSDGTSWHIETVDPQGQGRMKKVLDKSDHPHLIYGKNEQTEIYYAFHDGQKWTRILIDRSMNPGQAVYDRSIQVDSRGRVHICYGTDYSPQINTLLNITYALYEDDSLAVVHERIDGVGNTGKWNSMTLDSNENPSVAYYNTIGKLQFARHHDGVWNVDRIDSDDFLDNYGHYPFIRYGSDQKFYISFQSLVRKKLRLAVGNPGSWQVEDITALRGSTTFTTPAPLALDHEGKPFVAFYDYASGDLKLAYKVQGDWQITTIDSAGNVGEHSSLAMTPSGLPAISYYDATNGYLRLAVASKTPPLDSDGDMLPDYLEIQLGSDAFDKDSDDDGLSDSEEDLNGNGMVERFETDPRNPDTDYDGIPDGVEIGRTTGIPARGTIGGTNPQLFKGDVDPSTKTNPLIFDTDRDGLGDGSEDKNANGRVDVDESDPKNPDTDADGLLDGFEVRLGSSTVDLDSDDDGIADNDEDKNLNGVHEEAETNPGATDTDGDGVADGIELGVLAGIPDPDGDGPLKGTAQDLFKPDTDPTVNSNALLWDSDGDGLSDGEEDANRNGAVDPGETHFLKNDSDGDGVPDGDEAVFGSDPLQATSRARIDALFTDSFLRTDLAGWEIVDEGTIEAPSDWQTFENALLQTGNIWGGTEFPGAATPNRPGTFIGLKNFSGTDVKISFVLRSNDDDELGILFRFKDKDNYYRLSLDSQQGYRRLTKIVNGNASVITAQSFSFKTSHDYPVVVYAVGSNLQVYLEGRRVFDIRDETLEAGSIAFFTWKNDGAFFKNVKIAGHGTVVSVDEDEPPNHRNTPREFSVSEVFPNPSSGEVQVFLRSTASVLVSMKVFDVLGRVVNEFEDRLNASSLRRLAWNGRSETENRLPAGIYFLQIRLLNPASPGRILWQQRRKVIHLD